MSEIERRRGYRYNRVLIETERVLDPQFDDAGVYLTGAQVEMLRNVTQYLRRLETYVTEYNPGYYLTPTVADYDDILAIVADLEEKLMGNPNTLWGYKERWAELAQGTSTGGASTNATTIVVPAGYLHQLEGWTAEHNDTEARGIFVAVVGASATVQIYVANQLAPNIQAYGPAFFTLKEDDHIQFTVWGLATGKVAYLQVWGTKMVVP